VASVSRGLTSGSVCFRFSVSSCWEGDDEDEDEGERDRSLFGIVDGIDAAASGAAEGGREDEDDGAGVTGLPDVGLCRMEGKDGNV